MATLIRTLQGDFDQVLRQIVDGVMDGSISATLEESWDPVTPEARCSVRIFERYTMWGGNRVSLSVTLFQVKGGPIQLCAVTSGGSGGIFKLDTVGEETFLDTLRAVLK